MYLKPGHKPLTKKSGLKLATPYQPSTIEEVRIHFLNTALERSQGDYANAPNVSRRTWYNSQAKKTQRAARAEKQWERRAQKKIDEGLDPYRDRRSAQRPDESDEAYAKRLETNRKVMERRHNKKQKIADGTWLPKPKLTAIEKRQKKAEYARDRRLALKQKRAQDAAHGAAASS